MDSKGLRDETIVQALMNAPTVTAAAEMCGCARSTIYSRLHDAAFVEKLNGAVAERRRVADALAAHALELASERLLELLQEPGVSDDVRLKAATAVLRAFG